MPRSRIIARISFIPQLSYLGLDRAPLYPAGFHLPAGDPLTVLLDFQRLHLRCTEERCPVELAVSLAAVDQHRLK